MARSVILAFPPVWEPDHPHLAIPQLAGALRASGIDVQPWDLNIEFLWAQLSPPALAAIAEEQLKRLAALSQRETLVGLDAARYATALEAVLLSETVEGTASRSLEALRHREEWSSPELFSTCWRTIRRGLQVASAPFFPVRMSLDSLEGPWDPRSLSDLLAAAANPSLNPYHGPIRRLLAGRLRRSDPLLLGISLIEPAQLLATFTLLQACREQAPALPLLIGGPLCTLLQREALPPALFDLVDGVVLGEGETPLVHIAWALAEGRPWDDAPNLVRRLADGQVVANPLGEEDLRRWPGPSFAGLPLERYLLPERVLPLEFSRGCSWRKCAFCASNYGHRRLSSVLQATAVVEQMKRLHAEHGARHFFFTDEALPPGPLRQMAKQVAAEQLPFRWFGEIRLDRGLQPPDLALLAAGGCRMLVFGLESGHPRTLDAMRKGIELDHADLLLRACVEQGIAVHLWLITGFPGESEAEAKASLDFVLDRPWLHGSSNFSATFNYFQMTRACPLAQEGGVGLCRIGQRKCRPEHDLDLDLEVPYSILPRDDGQQPIPPERTAEMAGLLQGMLDDVLGDAPRRTGRADSFLRQCFAREGQRPGPGAGSNAGIAAGEPGPGAGSSIEITVAEPEPGAGNGAGSAAGEPEPRLERLLVVRSPAATLGWSSHPISPGQKRSPEAVFRRLLHPQPIVYHMGNDRFMLVPESTGELLEALTEPRPLLQLLQAQEPGHRGLLLGLLASEVLELQREDGEPVESVSALGCELVRSLTLELLADFDQRLDAGCPAGCSRCCRHDEVPPVWPAEVPALRRALRGLEPEALQQVLQHARSWALARDAHLGSAYLLHGHGDCPLVGAGCCRIYADRPMRCVLFGYPIAQVPGNLCPLRHPGAKESPQALRSIPTLPAAIFQFWQAAATAAVPAGGGRPRPLPEVVIELLE